jgi:hypothetical protein
MLLRLRLCPCVLRVIILTIYIEMCLFLQHTNTTNMEGWCLLSLPNTNRLNNKCPITACYPRCLAPIAPHSYVSRWFLALRRFFLPKPQKHRKQPPKPPLLWLARSIDVHWCQSLMTCCMLPTWSCLLLWLVRSIDVHWCQSLMANQ